MTPKKNLAALGPADRATDHQVQGRQSAVDKKRGRNPVKKNRCQARQAGGYRGGKEYSLRQPGCLAPK